MTQPCVIVPVAVGKKVEIYGENFNVRIGKFSAKENEWSHETSFKAFQFPQPHTFQVNII